MEKKHINLLKGIFEIALIILVLFVMEEVLMLKSEDGYDQMRSFYKQPQNTIDALFLGSSKMYCQVDTGILWDEYGISGFDLGGAESPSWNGYYHLREALKTQKPKVVIFDAGIIGNMPEVEFQRDRWVITNNYGMKWNENRMEQLRTNTEDSDGFRRLLFPLDTMHSRYSELTKIDFKDVNDSINNKGFDYKNATTSFEKPDTESIVGITPISPKQEEYILKMKEYADANDVEFIVVIAPYPVKTEEQEIFNYIGEMCEKNNIPYINFNLLYDELDLDFATDFAEELHLNAEGTRKFTEYLGSYLCNSYNLEDHRGDSKYSSWDKDALINRQIRKINTLNATINAEEVDELTSCDEYIQFYVDEMANLKVYVSGEEVIYKTGADEYKAVLNDNDTKIVIKRLEDTTTIYIGTQKYKIGWPWRRKIVYDRVLDRVVFDRDYYEE